MLSMSTNKPHLITAAAAATALLAGAGATAAVAQDPPTTSVTVREATTLKAGDTSPFDVGGVRAIRRGKPIPAGYVLPGRTVTIDASGPAAGAAIRFTCPQRKRLRSFATRGSIGFSVTDSRYPGRRSTVVISLGRSGRTDTGTIYAVCR
jgi:hypothetical protein